MIFSSPLPKRKEAMTDTRTLHDLPPAEQRLIQRSVEELQREFQGTFDDETIEHFVVDSYERLAAKAKVTTFIGVLSNASLDSVCRPWPRSRAPSRERRVCCSSASTMRGEVRWPLDGSVPWRAIK